MHRVKAGGAMLAVMVAVAAPVVLADAKGKVNVKGASFTVVDAVAYKDDDNIEVALLPAAFNRKDAVKDRKIDSFDVMRMDGGHVSADVTFDVPVEGEVARTGTALPPDGGEPGRAVLAHFGAIEKNDFNALKATAAPERQAMMTASEKSGEATEMFKMLRSFSPRKVRVVGGTVDGDTALVDYEGVEDGKPVKGTADVVRIGGKWYFEGSSSR